MTFHECLMFCAKQSELVENFNRLTGYKLGEPRSPIDQMIDQATGLEDEAMREFISFVHEFVWLRLPREVSTS